MKTLLILSLLLVSGTGMAQTLRLSGTGSKALDGYYKRVETVNGRNRYEKTANGITYQIYCRRDGAGSVWMLEDSRQNTYFAANVNTVRPPASGWDVGRAGKGLNAGFSLVEEPEADALKEPDRVTIKLRNNSSEARQVVVRTLLGEEETVRARTFQPNEVYEYQVKPGSRFYLLTRQEGQQLMENKSPKPEGRLLLVVKSENQNEIYSLNSLR